MNGILVKHSQIKKLSGQAAYRKGVAYAEEAAEKIEVLEDNNRSLVAAVKGSFEYRTEIHNLYEGLEESHWDCSCPAADDGSFCKHCVALLLQVVGLPKGRKKKVDSALEKENQQNKLVDYLLDLSKEELADLLLNEAKRNESFQDYLLAKSQGDKGEALDVKALKKDITATFRVRGFLYRGQVGPWAQDVFAMLEVLESFIAADYGAEVAELLEHAHKRLETAFNNMDDSNGWLTEISYEIAKLHVKACEQSDVSSKKLVKRLFKLEMESEFDTFRPVAERYGHILGDDGLKAYRKLLLVEWEGIEKEPDGSLRFGSYRVLSARKALALAEKNDEEFLEICESSRFFADDYLSLAKLYLEQEEKEKALQTAKEGMAQCRNHQTADLSEFILEMYRGVNNQEAILEHLFDQFKVGPSLAGYERILREAGEKRDVWDKRLQDTLLQDSDNKERNPYLYQHPASVLAEIFMNQKRFAEAWELHQNVGLGNNCALQLARSSANAFPLQAITVFHRQASDFIDKKDKKFYKRATHLLQRIERVAAKADKREVFAQIMQEVVEKHYLKVNLMKEFRELGWIS